MTAGSPSPETLSKILELCAAAHPEASISAESSLTRDLGMDSLQALELISEIETTFGVSIPSEMLPEADTVSDVARLVERVKNK